MRFLVILIRILKILISTGRGFVYDLLRYINFSKSVSANSRSKLESSIIAHYHVLEKGLSLPRPKRVYGENVARGLMELLKVFEDRKYDRSGQYEVALAVLKAYRKHHVDVNDTVLLVDQFLETRPLRNQIVAGTESFTLEQIRSVSKKEYTNLLNLRRSFRDFDQSKLDADLISSILDQARRTPSVCNRQSAFFYLIQRKELIRDVLKIQEGNRGFTDRISNLGVICGDLNSFESERERNQVFVDGGLYAMNLMLACTANGIITCPLNWSATVKKDKELRRILPLKNSHNVIMLLAIGHPLKENRYAISSKRDIGENFQCIE